MNDNNQIWKLIIELTNADIKFVICGGVACFLQGVMRFTEDLDISLQLNDENIQKLIKVAKQLNLKSRNPEPIEYFADPVKREKWIKEKNALVFTLVSDRKYAQLDIFLKYHKSFDELLSNADKIEIGGIQVLVSSKEDLIAAKEQVNPIRDKDMDDIRDLKKLIDNNG